MTTKKIYGLIGYPLEHSFSRSFFNEKFKNEQIDAEYVNFEIADVSSLREIVKENYNLCGLNVTIPYKMDVISLLDDIDDTAAKIGAVNVIKILRCSDDNIFLKGYNTDAEGFTMSIKPLLKPYHKKALLLGTGGVSKAIIYALTSLGVEVLSVSRDKKVGNVTYSELDEPLIKSHKVIVNATPLGMYPNIDRSPMIPYKYIDETNLIFDTIYNPTETMLIKLAAANGAIVKNGLEMLHGQAIAAWKIWNE